MDEILKAQLKIFLKGNDWPIGPVVDGYFLPGMKTINLKEHYGTERERPSQPFGIIYYNLLKTESFNNVILELRLRLSHHGI